MPTNDERREVAVRLRERKPWDIFTNFEDCIGDLCDAVFEDDGDLNDMFRLQAALADLIEPEPERTCKPSNKCGFPTCDCGELFKDLELPNYCPNCGARVKEGE